MHRAPAISVSIGKSRAHRGAISILWFLGCVVSLVYGFDQKTFVLNTLVAVALSGAGFIAWRGWHCTMPGVLRWDGQNWYWSGFGVAGLCHMVLALDLQTWMLVKVHTAGKRKVWLWLDAPSVGVKWAPLRRAIVASRRPSEHPTYPSTTAGHP